MTVTSLIFLLEFIPSPERMAEAYQELKRASLFAKISELPDQVSIEKKLLDEGFPICYHRYHAFPVDDVSIYYKGFRDFVDNCQNIDITKGDCEMVLKFCYEMSKLFTSEQERVGAILSFFRAYISRYFKKGPTSNYPDADISLGSICLVEVKNEQGSGNCDPLREIIRYYIYKIDQHDMNTRRVCFLLDITGPNMTIYGAVHGQHVFIDRLVPTVWLVPQQNNIMAMIHMVKVLKAFRVAVLELYNRQFTFRFGIEQARYPDLCEIEGKEIEYTDRIKPHVFRGKLQGAAVIIKFANRYGAAVHKCLANEEFAPPLQYCEKFGRFTAVVMDEVGDPVCVDKYVRDNPTKKDSVKEQCEKILEILCKQKYVHGDLRNVNVLVDQSGKVKVIDFDWAGDYGDVKYPMFLNHQGIEWPNGATDGQPITHQHDKYWVDLNLSY